MSNREITIDDAEFLLADILKQEKSGRKITIETILKKVADHFVGCPHAGWHQM